MKRTNICIHVWDNANIVVLFTIHSQKERFSKHFLNSYRYATPVCELRKEIQTFVFTCNAKIRFGALPGKLCLWLCLICVAIVKNNSEPFIRSWLVCACAKISLIKKIFMLVARTLFISVRV